MHLIGWNALSHVIWSGYSNDLNNRKWGKCLCINHILFFFYSWASLISWILFFSPVFWHGITRMEKVALRSSSTKAKIIGTLTSISGALVVVFYKGPKVISSPTRTSSVLLQRPLGSSQSNWIIGGLLEAVAYLLYSLWYIIQVKKKNMYFPSSIMYSAIPYMKLSLNFITFYSPK